METLPARRIDAWRYSGHCYFQAAQQSGDSKEFYERMRRARDCFGIAARAADDDSGKQTTVDSLRYSLRYRGLEKYCQAQLSKDTSTVTMCLHETFDLLAASWRLGEEHSQGRATTLAIELIIVTNDLTHYEPKADLRIPKQKYAIQVVESSDRLAGSLDPNLHAFLFVESIDLLLNAWVNLPSSSDRKAAGRRGLALLDSVRKALREATDPRASVAAYAVQIEMADLLQTMPETASLAPAHQAVEATKDRAAIGSFFAASLRDKMYRLGNALDPAEGRGLRKQGEEDALRALLELLTFARPRRWRDSPGYVYWSRADLLTTYYRWFAESRQERQELLKKTIEDSKIVGENSPPSGLSGQYSNLGFRLYDLALQERERDERGRILEEAWKAAIGYQTETGLFYPHWDYGNSFHYLLYGRIKRELAKLLPADDTGALSESVEMYQKAVDSLDRAVGDALSPEDEVKRRDLVMYKYELGTTQLELYEKTQNTQLLESALLNLRSSAETARTEKTPTRAAEAFSKIGETYMLADRPEQAQLAFSEASQRYKEASTAYPGLATMFSNQSALLGARASGAAARGSYLRNRFDTAALLYRDANRAVELVPGSASLAAVYDGWAMLADAEGLSSTEPRKATSMLEAAASRFSGAEKKLQTGTLENFGVDDSTETLRHVLSQGRKYAEARFLLEKARILEREGELSDSIEQLNDAAKQFDGLAKEAHGAQTQEMMRNNAQLCRASCMMLRAEEKLGGDLYSKAAVLFQEVKKSSRTRSAAAIAGGWAACCKALELGYAYRESADKGLFDPLKKQLANARAFFAEAGMTGSSAWVAATGAWFDALALIAEAESRINREQRETLLREAEEHLQSAAELFEQAGYPTRKEDTLRYLRSTREQRAHLQAKLVSAPPLVQSVTEVAAQTFTPELAEGKAGTKPPLHAEIRTPAEPLYVGHETTALLTILNPGQSTLRLVRLDNVHEPGLEMLGETDERPVGEAGLALLGRRVSPLELEQVPIRLRPRKAGRYSLKPTVVYAGPLGDELAQQLAPIEIAVEDLGVRAWLRGPGK